jgi:hypothetical protein
MSLNVTRPKFKSPRFLRVVHLSLATLGALVLFITASPSLAASPQPQSTNPPQAPNATCPAGGQCFADVLSGSPFYAYVNRIYQQDLVSGYDCGGPGEPCDTYSRPYYRPANNVTRQQMAKFIDNARRLPQIYIETASSDPLIYVSNTVGMGVSGSSSAYIGVLGVSNTSSGVEGISNSGIGVVGQSTSDVGVWGDSHSGLGVYGRSIDDTGVWGSSDNDTGVYGGTSGTGTIDAGVWGFANAPAHAGYFNGNVHVNGTLSKSAGSFKIDHPQDPANKYLYHSFVESPDMKNIYDGNVTTDNRGEATVVLPSYFEALNRDFRYQLTVIGEFAQAIVSSEIKDNRFTIKTDKPNVKVSWQVTGIRQDPYANAHRIPVEEDKLAGEKGKYLHPTEWGQPESSGIDYEKQQRMQEVPQSKP